MNKLKSKYVWLCLLVMAGILPLKGQTGRTGQVDIFCGAELNYRDIFHNKVYEFLINLTPGIKWYMGKGWQAAGQAYIPIYNDYGVYYKRVRLNMAVLSKESHWKGCWFLKASGGLFGNERYGLDLKGMFLVNDWLAVEAQAGWTGFCSMAAGWHASTPKRWIALAGADVYLNRYDTQFRLRGGRYVYKDYGAQLEVLKHFKHCTVTVYGEYSDQWGKNAGFKVIMMIPPYKRKQRKVNVRPASNFRFTNDFMAYTYANLMYITDPEENEREGWFDRQTFRWGVNRKTQDFTLKQNLHE